MVLLLKSYARQKFEKVGHVDIPTKRITTVSLKLIDGEKLIYRGLNDAESFLQNIPLLNNLIIFIDENKINVYDKKTKTLKNLSVPEEIRMKTENNSNIYISAYDLNDRTILVSFINGDENLGTYLFDSISLIFTPLPQFDGSCEVFCVGPWLEKTLSDNEFIIKTAGGDACAGFGTIFILSLVNKSVTELFDFTSGCLDQKDDYIGFAGNLLIAADFESVADPSDKTFGKRTVYRNLYSLNFSKVKNQLISSEEMPENINNIWIDEKAGIIFLSDSLENSKTANYFAYSLSNNSFGKTEFDKVTFLKNKSVNNNKIYQNSEFIATNITVTPLGEIKKVAAWNIGLRVTDSDGDLVTIIPVNFIIGKFEAEKNDPRLQGEMNIYRNYDFLNPQILDKDHIKFTGVVRYSNQVVESRNFLLNLKNENIFLLKDKKI